MHTNLVSPLLILYVLSRIHGINFGPFHMYIMTHGMIPLCFIAHVSVWASLMPIWTTSRGIIICFYENVMVCMRTNLVFPLFMIVCIISHSWYKICSFAYVYYDTRHDTPVFCSMCISLGMLDAHLDHFKGYNNLFFMKMCWYACILT